MKRILSTLMCIVLAIMLFGCSNPVSSRSTTIKPTSSTNVTTETNPTPTVSSTPNKTENTTPQGKLTVHYIDVGQGDSILVQQGGMNMLIDTGTNASTDSLIAYLKNQNIKKIDYLVLTHAHEDHIGGADAVINDFNIGTLFMMKYMTTTQTYKDVLEAMASKGLKATQPSLGSTFKIGEANCVVYGPVNPDSQDLNTCSIVIKLTYGSTKFLFTGDAQSSNEEAMIDKGYDLSVNVLKVGHHGSHTSTTEAFLDKVNPKYAVISVGKNNDYGHPHQETLDNLNAKGINIYRTDLNGTVIATSDGKDITFNCKPSVKRTPTKAPTPEPTSTTKPTPTSTPVPTQSNVKVSASVDNPTPAQYSTIHLTVNGPAGGSASAVCHYKSTDTNKEGTIGADGNVIIPFDISRAAKDYTAIIDITVNYNGKTYTTQTSFTPK